MKTSYIIISKILLITFLMLTIFMFGNAQSLSCNNEVNFRISNDSIYVTSNEITMMPMVRYEFVFQLVNNKTVTLVYTPNSFNGDVSVNIPRNKKILLKKYQLEKIKIYSPLENYVTNKFTDRRYFIKNL
jgi:hypothetical protein